jgi:toxin ParE1/3/4
MTASRIRVPGAAQRDLDQHTDYLLAKAGPDTAGRFIEQARASFNALAQTPGMGPIVEVSDTRLSGLRKWRVEGFPKILIFYLPTGKRIRIIRVLHTAADWWSLLDVR